MVFKKNIFKASVFKVFVPSEGYLATISVDGTTVALLDNINLSCRSDVTSLSSFGEAVVSDIFVGLKKFSGGFGKAYVNNDYLNFFLAGTILIGSIFPCGGTTPYITGTIKLTSWILNNMVADVATPVVVDCTFVMYNVSKS